MNDPPCLVVVVVVVADHFWQPPTAGLARRSTSSLFIDLPSLKVCRSQACSYSSPIKREYPFCMVTSPVKTFAIPDPPVMSTLSASPYDHVAILNFHRDMTKAQTVAELRDYTKSGGPVTLTITPSLLDAMLMLTHDQSLPHSSAHNSSAYDPLAHTPPTTRCGTIKPNRIGPERHCWVIRAEILEYPLFSG